MWNSRIARSQATTMKIRNRNGRSHAAFSALDTMLGPFASATSRSLAGFLFRGEINPLDKYWQVAFVRQFAARAAVGDAEKAPSAVMPGLDLGIHDFPYQERRRGWPGQARP